MKRLFINVILICTIIVTSVPVCPLPIQVEATEAKISFNDMKGSEWYYADIMNLVSQGVIDGYPDGTFGPSKTITFAEFLAIALKSVEKDIQVSPADSHWAMGTYNTAVEKGIITNQEFGKSTSDLNAPISREDMALILIRLNELVQKETKADTSATQAKIPDFIKISRNRQDYVLQAYQKGLISGKGNGFDPKGKTTRAEASVVVLRLIDPSKRGNIEDIVVGELDVHGRAIRTTNLPKNASWFPYIVEGIPNWAYEQTPFDDNYFGPSRNTNAPEGASKVAMFPKDVHASPDAISRVMPDMYDELNEFMEAYLNVDYRTIDKKHYASTLTNLTDIRTTSLKSEKELKELFEIYADYIKNSKVIIESTFEILPESTWVTIGDQVGVMNFSVYTKMKTVQTNSIFNMPGTVQINKSKSTAYPNGVIKSTVKAGQELEGVFTVTLLRVGMGEWKIHYSSLQPLMSLNPLRDTMNGVAPSKKSKDRLTHFSYTWCKDDTEFYTRNAKDTKSRFTYE